MCVRCFILSFMTIFFVTVVEVEKETSDNSDDEELENLLKEFKISNLYKKFRSIGVTSDILWDVTDATLQAKGFDDIQIMRFSKARNAHVEKTSKKIGSFKFHFAYQIIAQK